MNDLITLVLNVQSVAGSAYSLISPPSLPIVSGDGNVNFIGTYPQPAPLNAYSSTQFTWTFVAVGGGQVTFDVHLLASNNTGQDIQSNTIVIGTLPTPSPTPTPSPSGPLIHTIAGTGVAFEYNGDGILAILANITRPEGVALDGAGNIYVVENSGRIRKIQASDGFIATVAGGDTQGYSGDGGPATSAQFNNPVGVAVDGGGNLYIADSGNNVIRKVWVSDGHISTVAGTGAAGWGGDGGPAVSALLNGPVGVAIDASGNLFIADTQNQVVRKVWASDGHISTVAGMGGTEGFAGDGGPATAASLTGPMGVAISASGNLYIADAGNNRVREVLAPSGSIVTLAGGPILGPFGDGGPALSAGLAYPVGVALDPSENVYIVDKDDFRIREILKATGVIETVAGIGSQPMNGYGYNGDNIPAVTAELQQLYCVAVDPEGNVIIADTFNNRVRVVGNWIPGNATPTGSTTGTRTPSTTAMPTSTETPSVTTVTTVSDSATASPTAFSTWTNVPSATPTMTPTYIPYASDVVWSTAVFPAVPQIGQQMTVVLSAQSTGGSSYSNMYFFGNPYQTVSGTGAMAYVSGPLPYASQLNSFGTASFTWIYQATANGSVVLRAWCDSQVDQNTGEWIQSDPIYIGAPGPTSSPSPTFSDTVMVSPSASPTFTLSPTPRSTAGLVFTGTLTATPSPSVTVTPTATLQPCSVMPFASGFSAPGLAALDPWGNLVVADSGNHQLKRVAPDGSVAVLAGTGSAGFGGDGGPATAAVLDSPYGVAVGGDGTVFFSDSGSHRVRRIGPDGTVVTVAGDGTAAAPGLTLGASALDLPLAAPSGLAIAGDGSLLVAEAALGALWRVAPDGGFALLAGGNGVGFEALTVTALAGHLASPEGLAVDAAGAIYIAEAGNHAVRRVTSDGKMAVAAGQGVPGLGGDGGPATLALLNAPEGLVLDGVGALFIADTGNHRLRRMDASGGLATVAGTGQGNAGDGGPALLAQFNAPRGVVVDQYSQLLLVDSGNGRLRRVIQCGASPYHRPSMPVCDLGRHLQEMAERGPVKAPMNPGRTPWQVTLAPNPVESGASLCLAFPGAVNGGRARIYNCAGRLLSQRAFGSDGLCLVAPSAPGIYFLALETDYRDAHGQASLHKFAVMLGGAR